MDTKGIEGRLEVMSSDDDDIGSSSDDVSIDDDEKEVKNASMQTPIRNNPEHEGMSNYELLRLERIRRNQEKLAQLGLYSSDSKPGSTFLSPLITQSKKKKKKKNPTEKHAKIPIKKSRRERRSINYAENKISKTDKEGNELQEKKKVKRDRIPRFIYDELFRMKKERSIKLKNAEKEKKEAEKELRYARKLFKMNQMKEEKRARERRKAECEEIKKLHHSMLEKKSELKAMRDTLQQQENKLLADKLEELNKVTNLIDKIRQLLDERETDLMNLLNLDHQFYKTPMKQLRGMKVKELSKNEISEDTKQKAKKLCLSNDNRDDQSSEHNPNTVVLKVALRANNGFPQIITPISKFHDLRATRVARNVGGPIELNFTQKIERSWLETETAIPPSPEHFFVPQVGDTVLYYPLGHKDFIENNSNFYFYRNKKNKPFWQKYEWTDDFFSKKLGNHAILCKVKNTYNEFPLSIRKQGKKKKQNQIGDNQSSFPNSIPLALHLVLKPLVKVPVQETNPNSKLITSNGPFKINPQRLTKLDNKAEILISKSNKKPKEDHFFKVHIFPHHQNPPFVLPFVWTFKHYHELSLNDCVRFRNRHIDYIESGKWIAGRIIEISKGNDNYEFSRSNLIPVDDLKLIQQPYLHSNTCNQDKQNFDALFQKMSPENETTNKLCTTNLENWPTWNSITVHLFNEYGGKQCKVSPWEIISIDNEEKNDSTSMKTRFNGKPRWKYSSSTKIADSLVYTLDNVVRKQLEDTLVSFSRKESLKPFNKKITKITAPLYYTVVPLPMYIEKVLRRLKYTSTHGNIDHCYYRSSGSFMSDIYEIINNCVLYNNPRSSIVDDAIQFGQKMKNMIVEAERFAKNEQRQRLKKVKNGNKKLPSQSTRLIEWDWIYQESNIITNNRHLQTRNNIKLEQNIIHPNQSNNSTCTVNIENSSLNNVSIPKQNDIANIIPIKHIMKDIKHSQPENDAELNINLNRSVEKDSEYHANISKDSDLKLKIVQSNAKPKINDSHLEAEILKEQINYFQKENKNNVKVELNPILGHQCTSKMSANIPGTSDSKVGLEFDEKNKFLFQNTITHQSVLSNPIPSETLTKDTNQNEMCTTQEGYGMTFMEYSWLPQAGDCFLYNEFLHTKFISFHKKSLTESQRILPSIPLSFHGDKWIRGHILKVRFMPPELSEVPPYSFEQCLPVAKLHVLFDHDKLTPHFICWRPCRLSMHHTEKEQNTISSTKKEEQNKKIGCHLYEKEDEAVKCPCGLDFKLSFIYPSFFYQSPLVKNAEEMKINQDLARRILNCFEILKLRCMNDVSPNFINADEIIKNIECRPYQHQKDPAMNSDQSSYFMNEEHQSKLLDMCFRPFEDKKGHLISPKICFNVIINRVRNGYYRDKAAVIDDLQNCFVVCSLNIMKHMAPKIIASLRVDKTEGANKSHDDCKSLKSKYTKKLSQFELNEALISFDQNDVKKKRPLKLSSKEFDIKCRIKRLKTLFSAALLSVNLTEEMEIILCIRKPPFKPDASHGRTIVKNDLKLSSQLLDSLSRDRVDNHAPIAALEPNPTVKIRISHSGVENGDEQQSNFPPTLLIEPQHYEGNKKLTKSLFGTANKHYACIRCQAANRDMLHCRVRKGHSNPDFDILGFAKSGGLENLFSRLKSHIMYGEAQNNSSTNFEINLNSPSPKESLFLKDTEKSDDKITIIDCHEANNDAKKNETKIENSHEKDCLEESGDFDCKSLSEKSQEDITPKMLLNMTEYAVLLADMNVSISKFEMDSPLNLSERFIRENFPIDENDGHYEFCIICGLGGDVLCCEGCPCVAHKHCVNLNDVPEGDWFCSYCVDTNICSRQDLKKGINGNFQDELSLEDKIGKIEQKNQSASFIASTTDTKKGKIIDTLAHVKEEKKPKQRLSDQMPNINDDNKSSHPSSQFFQTNKEKRIESSKVENQTKFEPKSENETKDTEEAKPIVNIIPPDYPQVQYDYSKIQSYDKYHRCEWFENASTFEDLMEMIQKYKVKHEKQDTESAERLDQLADSNSEPCKNQNKLKQEDATDPFSTSIEARVKNLRNEDTKDTNLNDENSLKNIVATQVGATDCDKIEVDIKVGTKILKSFDDQGNFVGTVKRLPTKRNPYFKIVYGDGDKEELSDGEVHEFAHEYLVEENTKKLHKKRKKLEGKDEPVRVKGKRGRPKKRKTLTKKNCQANINSNTEGKREEKSKDELIRNEMETKKRFPSNTKRRRGRPRKVR